MAACIDQHRAEEEDVSFNDEFTFEHVVLDHGHSVVTTGDEGKVADEGRNGETPFDAIVYDDTVR